MRPEKETPQLENDILDIYMTQGSWNVLDRTYTQVFRVAQFEDGSSVQITRFFCQLRKLCRSYDPIRGSMKQFLVYRSRLYLKRERMRSLKEALEKYFSKPENRGRKYRLFINGVHRYGNVPPTLPPPLSPPSSDDESDGSSEEEENSYELE